jgi:hypothetical protein
VNIHILHTGNFGNRALQYLTAAGIQSHAPGATIHNIILPECGIWQPAYINDRANTVATHRGWLDIAGYADCLTRGVVGTIIVDDYPFHLQNYPARRDARALIPPLPGGQNATGFGPEDLVCSIRGDEILRAAHPDYLPLPPAYYRMLARRTGKNLVFFGQIGDDAYSYALRRAFPAARFIASGGADYDFEMLRRSVHIAPSVSTFAWLAAWLSHAEKIYLPVCGFLNPVQHAEMLFLPLDDETYEYTLFPYAKAVDLFAEPARFFLQQDVLARAMRPITAEELRQVLLRMRGFHLRRPYVAGFDADFYLACNPDVRAALGTGLPSALQHYVYAGFPEGRLPMRFDSGYYATAYPDAALAIAEGHFADSLHHYQAVGYGRGYQPVP